MRGGWGVYITGNYIHGDLPAGTVDLISILFLISKYVTGIILRRCIERMEQGRETERRKKPNQGGVYTRTKFTGRAYSESSLYEVRYGYTYAHRENLSWRIRRQFAPPAASIEKQEYEDIP